MKEVFKTIFSALAQKLAIFRGKNLYDLTLRVKVGQNYDPLLLDPTELRFQAKNNMRVALCDNVMDVLNIVRKNGQFSDV